MKLNTGKIGFPIEFDNGDKECIYFNPNDPNLSLRLIDFENKISSRMDELDDIELDAKGKPQSIKKIESFRKFQNILYEEMDIAFGGEVSAIVFKHCSPFAIIDGEYFIIQFIEAIRPEIEKHIKIASEEINKKVEKHIGKYAK